MSATRSSALVPAENEESAFDDYSKNYTEALERGLSISGEGQEYFARERVGWVARSLSELAFRPRRILDFGCGQGSSTPLLVEALNGSEAVGVDVSRGLLAVASRNNNDPRISYSISKDLVPDGSFDCVYTNGVLHHIPIGQRRAVLGYVYDSLAPGGILALWENNPWNPGTLYAMRRIPFDRDAITLTIPEALRLASESGFEVLETSSRFFFPRMLRFMRPLEIPLSRTWLGAQYMILCQKPRIRAN